MKWVTINAQISGRLGCSLCVDLKSSLPPFQLPTVRRATRPYSLTSRSTMVRSRAAASIVTPPSASDCRGLPGTSLKSWAITSARRRKKGQVGAAVAVGAAVRAPDSFRQRAVFRLSDARPAGSPFAHWRRPSRFRLKVRLPFRKPLLGWRRWERMQAVQDP